LEITEGKIISQCQEGKLENFTQLYDGYVRRIYSYIYRRTFHKQTAEDLAGQVFLKALERIRSFDSSRGNFSSWLFSIARNAVIDYSRTNHGITDIFQIPEPASSGSVETEISVRTQLEKVQQYLSKIDPEQREIVVMRVWDGLSYKEIAEVLGKTESLCKMSFSRTITKLRKHIPLSVLLVWLLNSNMSFRL